MTRGLFALVLLGATTACITGSDEEPKSNLEYLNGERYRAGNAVNGIPLTVEATPRSTTIKGTVREQGDGNALYQPPVRFARVVLASGDKVIASATTDEAGSFTIQGSIRDGTYRLTVDSPLFVGEKSVRVAGYDVPSVTLDARRK